MATVILDSNVYLANKLYEELSPNASELIAQYTGLGVELCAPLLLRYELIAVARKSAARARLTVNESLSLLDDFLSMEVRLYFDDDLMRRAFAIATDLNLPTAYDSQYLALAERLDCDFWTADQRLVAASSTTNLRVKWLGDFAAKTEANA